MYRCGSEDGTVLLLRDTRKEVVEWIYLWDKKWVVATLLINIWVPLQAWNFLKRRVIDYWL
jgi:hypothetical protein